MSDFDASALWFQVEAAKAQRAKRYPDEQACIRAIAEACQRLEELGWKKASYAPADGKLKATIELHSTGIHRAYCEPRPQSVYPGKWWWAVEHQDLWPLEPIYFKDLPQSESKGKR